MDREYHIIDGETHAIPPKDYYQRRWPKKYQDKAPKLVKDPKGGDAWQFTPGGPPNLIGLTVTAGMRYEDISSAGHTYESIRPGCFDAKERLKDMDIDGVDAAVVFSDNRISSFLVAENDVQSVAIQAHNDWIAEEWVAVDPSRYVGIAQMPNLGVKANIAELERVRNLGLKGVSPRTWPSGQPRLSPEDDLFWAACQDLDMPVAHIGAGHGMARPDFSAGLGTSSGGPAASSPALALAESAIGILREFIMTEVLDRFPRLRVGINGGAMSGWIPYALEHMDDFYWRGRASSGLKLRYLPSEYWQRNFYVAFMHDKYGVKNRDDIGVETMQWATDYPYQRTDWPYSRKVIDNHFVGVSEEEKRKIVCYNAAKTYGLI